MRGTGIESSRPPSLPRANGVVISMLVHAGLLASIMLVSAHLDSLPPKEPGPASAQFLYPLLRRMPKPVQEQVTYVGMDGVFLTPAPAGKPSPAPPADAVPPPTLVTAEEVPVPETERAFSEIEVDSAAVRDPESAGPTYPAKLLAERVEGATRVQFVVDSTGHVDLATIVILDSTHPEFTEAVKEVLPRMKYQPARIGKRPVAQLVEQRFGFRLAPPPPD